MLNPADPVVWTTYADRSYIASRLLWFTSLWMDAPVQAHRTVELYLKAFLVSHAIPIERGGVWGHDLGVLYDKCIEVDRTFGNADAERRLKFLNRYFEYVRYPSDPGSPEDGSLVWFSFESNILVLDELVGYVRPRIRIDPEQWVRSELTAILHGEDKTLRHRALVDANSQLKAIVCSRTQSTPITFSDFRSGEKGC